MRKGDDAERNRETRNNDAVSRRHAKGLPTLPYGYLERERASKRFRAAIERYPVIMLTAPNGYGKTAFLVDELSKSDRPVAWADIAHPVDSAEPVAQLVIDAIAAASPKLAAALHGRAGITAKELAAPEGPARLAHIAESLEPELVLVLDSFENAACHDAAAFAERLAQSVPASARLVIASAERPTFDLSRLTLAGKAFELTAANLTFNREETKELLCDKLGLRISSEEAGSIYTQMDGWIAGIRMVEAVMREGATAEEALAVNGDSQRSISDYLVRNIVQKQDEPVRTFLIESSLFPEFCPELCDHAFARSDSAHMIAQVENRNLFLERSTHKGWYRYANFFARCLRSLAAEAPESDRDSAYSRASEWFADNEMHDRAATAALRAGDYDRVAQLINHHYASFMGKDQSAKMLEIAHLLPPDKSPWTAIGAAVACEMQRRFAQELTYTSSAVEQIGENGAGGDLLSSSLQMLRMLVDYHRGDFDRGIKRGRAVLNADDLGQSGQCGVLCTLGILHWARGDANEALSCWRRSSNLATYTDWSYSLCLDLFGMAHARYVRGEYDSAVSTCQRALAVSAQADEPVLSSGYARMLLGKIHYDRNELGEARAEVEAAERIAQRGGEEVLAMEAEMAKARIELAEGNADVAVERANRCAASFFAKRNYCQSFDEVRSLLAQILLLARKPDLAEDLFGMPYEPDTVDSDVVGNLFGADFRNVWSEPPVYLRIYTLLEQGNLAGTDDLVERARIEAGKRELTLLVVKALILKALRANEAHEAESALAWTAEALSLAEQSGCTRAFLDAGKPMYALLRAAKRGKITGKFGDRILATFEAGSSAGSEQAGKSNAPRFTGREREIARHLCAGETNDEIATALYLSLSTVKNHIHHIYTKLGVRNRSEAIVKLQGMG